MEAILAESFTEFFRLVQPRLERALVAAFRVEVGVEATSDCLTYGWKHWERVGAMENPAGYLYRVGRSRARRYRRRPLVLPVVRPNPLPWVQPGLPRALAGLSERQRVAVIPIYSLGWTQAEVGDLSALQVALQVAIAGLNSEWRNWSCSGPSPNGSNNRTQRRSQPRARQSDLARNYH